MAVDQILLNDLANANIQAGLGEAEFGDVVRDLMGSIPIAIDFLEASGDVTVTKADCAFYLNQISGKEYSANDLWHSFVNWMAFFFPNQVMKQEISEIALRRASILPL